MPIAALLLAGGNSTRLAPLGTGVFPPKPFWPLAHPTQSLLQQTARRVAPIAQEIILVTQVKWAALGDAQLRDIPHRCLAEPAARNTAAAVLMAVLLVAETHADATLCILPCDHAIGDDAAFRQTMLRAVDAAGDTGICCIGIPPAHPSDQFGYLLPGNAFSEQNWLLAQFTEKPDAETAQKLIAGGALWNAGIFIGHMQTFLDAFARHTPELFAAANIAFATRCESDYMTFDAEAYAALPAQPIDRAVMEKAANLRMVAGDFTWADLGNWDAVHACRGDTVLTPPPALSIEVACALPLLYPSDF